MSNIGFSIDEVSDLEQKDTSQVLEYMKNDIPNQFVPMRHLIGEYGSNARTHVKEHEGTHTFRISRLDPEGRSKREIDFWTYVVPEVLSGNQLEKLTLMLRKEGYDDVSFDAVESPKVVELESVEESSDSTDYVELDDTQLREYFTYNRSTKEYICQFDSVEVYKDQRLDYLNEHHRDKIVQ